MFMRSKIIRLLCVLTVLFDQLLSFITPSTSTILNCIHININVLADSNFIAPAES